VSTKATAYGTIHYGGPCQDNYGNIILYDQKERGWPVLKMQSPAIRSLKECEEKWARRTRGPWVKRRHIRVTGSHRTCAFQRECWENDPERFAHPDAGVHTRGLAIDVYNGGSFTSPLLKRILRSHGWSQSRPDDEPWHWSFGVTA
jgi:hypothetical protein